MEKLELSLPKLLTFIIAGVLLLAAYNIIKVFWPEPALYLGEDLGYDVSQNEDFDYDEGNIDDLEGYLYFDSIGLPSENATDAAKEESRLSANLYRYDFAGEVTVPLFEYGESYDGNPLSSNSIAFVAALSDGDGGTRSAHVVLDTTTDQYKELTNGDGDQAHELVVSPGNPNRIAFVFRNDDAEDQYRTSAYGILVSDYTLGTDVEIYEAVSPAWNADGTALYFVKEDGVYRYDLQTEESTLVSNVYTDHSVFTHLAVAPDESFLILTMPALNTISVMTLGLSDTGAYEATEIGVIQDTDVVYKTPVIAPDSRYYAVVAAEGIDGEREHSIEVRHYLDHTVTTSIIPDETDSRYLNLSGWGGLLVERSVSFENTPTDDLDL